MIIGGGSDVTKMLLLFSQHEVSCDCCKCTSFLSTFYFYSFKENTWIGWVITIIAPLHHNALRFFRQYTTSCSAGCIYAIYYQYSFMLIRASIIWQQLISMHIEERKRERERESLLQTFSSITHILFPVIIVYQESVLVITILRVLYQKVSSTLDTRKM